MASSQVEIACSSPFGYVLRDRNRYNHRDSNAFQKNLKDLVQTHLHSCISTQPNRSSASDSNQNSQQHHQHNQRHGHGHSDNADLWVHKPQWENNAREMVFSIDTKYEDVLGESSRVFQGETSPSSKSECYGEGETPNRGGVSSIVRRWRDFEAQSKSVNSTCCSTRSNCCDNASFVDAPHRGFDACDESSIDGRFETPPMSMNGDSIGDWESDRTAISGPPSAPGRDSDITESERLRVADIIRKLSSSSGEGSHDREHNGNAVIANAASLPRLRTSLDGSEQQRSCFSPVLNSPRIIRGRQALSDWLLQMEGERHRELEGLKERKAVSKFQQRGRIQALLRFRFLRRGAEVRDDRSINCTAPESESNRLKHSAIMHLREKFNTVGQRGIADSKSNSKEVAENTQECGNFPSTSNQLREENCNPVHKGPISPKREQATINTIIGFSSHQQKEGDRHKELVTSRTGVQPGVTDSSTPRASGDNTQELGNTCTSKEDNHHKPGSPHKEVVDNNPKSGKICTSSPLLEENHHEEVSGQISFGKVATTIQVSNSSDTWKEMTFSANNLEGFCRSDQHDLILNHQEVSTSLPHCSSKNSDNFPEQATRGKKSSEASRSKLLDFVETARPSEDIGANNKQHAGTNNEWSSDSTNFQSDWEEEATNQPLVENDCGWVSDYSHTPSGWDELQSNYQQQLEGNQDWISGISRPRKEWEGLRQTRYKEMLDPYSKKHDIHRLLRGKSVSIFLSSGLREKLEKAMVSRSQQLPNAKTIQVGRKLLEKVAQQEEEEGGMMLQGDAEVAEDHEEEDSGYDDDTEDDNSPIRQQYIVHAESVDQDASLRTLQPWSPNQDFFVTDESVSIYI